MSERGWEEWMAKMSKKPKLEKKDLTERPQGASTVCRQIFIERYKADDEAYRIHTVLKIRPDSVLTWVKYEQSFQNINGTNTQRNKRGGRSIHILSQAKKVTDSE